MPTYPISQTDFTGGEISELARARVDMERYGTSLKTARNTKIHVQGAISNRPGTIFGGPAHPVSVSSDSQSAKAVLVPFTVSESETYILAFTDYIAQVWTSREDGTPVPLSPPDADCPGIISVATSASGAVLTLDKDHDFVNGQNIFITNAAGDDIGGELIDSDVNGAYPRYTVELVDHDTLPPISDISSQNMQGLSVGDYTSPCALQLDAAATPAWDSTGTLSEGDVVDCYLTASDATFNTAAGTAFIALWETLTSPFGKGATDPYRLSAHIYYQTANQCAVELLWPGCTIPALASAAVPPRTPAFDELSLWGNGTREIYPVIRLSGGMTTEYAGNSAGPASVLQIHPIDKRKIRIRELTGTTSASLPSGGTALVHGIAQVRTPFTRDQSAEMQYAQSLDVLTCTHPEVSPHDITRYSEHEWLCDEKRLFENPPLRSLVATPDRPGDSHIFSYRIVTVDKNTGAYSDAAQVDVSTDEPIVLGSADIVFTWEQSSRDRNSHVHIFRLDAASGGAYKFLRELAGSAFGFTDDNSLTPAEGIANQDTVYAGLFTGAGNYPTTVNYNNQRLLFGGTTNHPERAWVSRVGNYRNFVLSDNVDDESAPIEFDLAVSTKLSSIFSSVALQQLVMMTDSGEISAGGGEGFASMTPLPGGLTLYPQSYYGAAPGIVPALADDAAIFVQKKGGAIRDIRYKADGLAGAAFGSREISVLASHLLDGETITSLAFADSPDSVAYAVTSSGALLAIAYSQEHGIVGFNRWDTGGISLEGASGVAQNDKFLDVAVIPEGDENGVYFSVLRYPPSLTNQLPAAATAMVFIERLSVTPPDRGVGFHNHLDCAMTYSVPVETTIIGAQVSTDNGYELLNDASPIAVNTRVDVFEKPGLRSSRNTDQYAYGQFAVQSNRTDAATGLEWSKLMAPSGTPLTTLPDVVDILDLEVRLPVSTIPAGYITHGLKGTASPTANGSGWRPAQTYGLTANGMFYDGHDPALPLPAPSGSVHIGDALASTAAVPLTSSVFTDPLLDKHTPALSPDGLNVAFMKKGTLFIPAIFRMDNTGGSAYQLSFGGFSVSDPAWSPDGTKIAFARDGDIFVMDSVTGEIGASVATNLTQSAGPLLPNASSPTWNSDGSRIAYQMLGGAFSPISTIYVIDPSLPGTGAELAFSTGTGIGVGGGAADRILAPVWRADGLEIAFSTNMGTQSPAGPADFLIKALPVTNAGVGTGSSYNFYTSRTAQHINSNPSYSGDGLVMFYESDRFTGGTSSDIFAQNISGGAAVGDEYSVAQALGDEVTVGNDRTATHRLVYSARDGAPNNMEIMLKDGGTFPGKASHFFLGEPFKAEVETNPLRSEKISDTASNKRVPQVGFRVTDTFSLNIATSGGDPVEWVAGEEVVGHNGALLYDGIGRVAVITGTNREQTVSVTEERGHPFTVSGLYPELEVDEE